MKIGVLALQGAFIEHIKMLNKLGVETFEIRQLKDIQKDFDALVLPGGESTVQGKLLKELGLFEKLKSKIKDGLPVFATCAGMILLANDLGGEKTYFETLPVKVKRNAYGRQLGSFFTSQKIDKIGDVDMAFIRAPYVEKADSSVEIISKVNEKIVAVKYKNQLAISFHPELTDNLNMHKFFIKMIENQ